MKILNAILSFITDPSKRTFVLSAALVVVAMLWFRSCEDKNRIEAEAKVKQELAEQNTRALTDSLHHVKLKDGETEVFKSAFIAKLSDLEKLNKDLYTESKKEIGDLKAIIKGGLTINNPLQVSNQLETYGNDNYGLKFEKTSDLDSLNFALKGVSKFSINNNVIVPGITDITDNQIKVKLILGVKESKDNYVVFARSPSKLLTVDSLSGSLIIPKKGGDIIPQAAEKKKRFGIGPSVGVGFGTNMQLMPIIGISVSYNIIRF